MRINIFWYTTCFSNFILGLCIVYYFCRVFSVFGCDWYICFCTPLLWIWFYCSTLKLSFSFYIVLLSGQLCCNVHKTQQAFHIQFQQRKRNLLSTLVFYNSNLCANLYPLKLYQNFQKHDQNKIFLKLSLYI